MSQVKQMAEMQAQLASLKQREKDLKEREKIHKMEARGVERVVKEAQEQAKVTVANHSANCVKEFAKAKKKEEVNCCFRCLHATISVALSNV